MKLKIPAKEVEACDSCSGTGYLQTCIVCGEKYCLICHAIMCGCVHEVDCCKKCASEELVNAVVKKFVPRLVRVLAERDAELVGVGAAVKKARRARPTTKLKCRTGNAHRKHPDSMATKTHRKLNAKVRSLAAPGSEASNYSGASLEEKPAVRSGVGGVKPLTERQCAKLERLFDRGAAKEKVLDAYWIHGADCGNDYCYQCCKKEVEKLKKKDPKGEYMIDGGWRSEHDSSPLCDGCGARLDGSLTAWGASQEVDHFMENGFRRDSTSDCYSMSEVISARGWKPWSERIYTRDYERDEAEQYFADLWTLGRRILGGEGAEHGEKKRRTKSRAKPLNAPVSDSRP